MAATTRRAIDRRGLARLPGWAAASTSAATSRWAAATWSRWPPSSAPRPTSTPRTTSAPAPAPTSTPSAPARDDFEVLYASKAAPITAVYRLFAEEGLSVDVASGGELHMALRAGFDPARIYMHGNNKTEAELRYAVDAGVGHVILDSFGEIARLDALLDRPQDVLIRRHAGDPALHPLLRPDRRARLEVRLRARGRAGGPGDRRGARPPGTCGWSGLHAHIGSQIFELEPYAAAIEALGRARRRRLECRILNVGGGLGIAYTAADEPPSIEDYVDVKVARRRARLRPGAADPDRAGALAGRQRGRHRLRDRDREGDPGRPDLPRRSTAGCRTTCGRCSTAPATRRIVANRAGAAPDTRRRSPACTASRATS